LAKFLVVHPFLDVYGGGERVCHNVIKSLVNHQQSVELLTFDFQSERYKEIVGEEFPKSVTIHSLGKRIEVKPPFTIYKRRSAFTRLLRMYRKSLTYDYLFSTQSSSPFEPIYLNQAKKNIAYVHFPEIHHDYSQHSFKRKAYLWLFKHYVSQGIGKLDLVFCNSNYTKGKIENYWKIKDPVIVYPPVNLDSLWCDTPLNDRSKRVIYVARFIPQKRHELLKHLASDLPDYEFVSVGGLSEGERAWFEGFSDNLPKNYSLKVNLPGPELKKLLQDSRVYVHLMEGEHFGIAPVEGLASGCVTLVHNSGGMKEFIPEEYRWQTYDDLKQKVIKNMDSSIAWGLKRKELWAKISDLKPEAFQNRIWEHVKNLMDGLR